MKITVTGGKALLITDGSAVRVTGIDDVQAILCTHDGDHLTVERRPPVALCFTKGGALKLADCDIDWLLESLHALGLVVYYKPRHRKEAGK